MVEEIWKPVLGYEDYYLVSNFGNVKSVDRYTNSKSGSLRLVRGRLLKNIKDKSGYLKVHLSLNGVCHKVFIHRIEWEAFNGVIPEGLQVNHIDENRHNNLLDNLNIMTPKENCNWGTHNEKLSNILRNRKDQSYTVAQYTLSGKLVRIWPSTKETQRNGYNQSDVSKCCNGGFTDSHGKWHTRNSAFGYIWRYI